MKTFISDARILKTLAYHNQPRLKPTTLHEANVEVQILLDSRRSKVVFRHLASPVVTLKLSLNLPTVDYSKKISWLKISKFLMA